METLTLWIDLFRDYVWSLPLLIFMAGTGVFLTFILRGVQFRYLGFAIKQAFIPGQKGAEGDISHFESLMTTLAGAIGTGAIVGVSTGLTIGGFGALFWMWVTALLGMALKYGESLLAVYFRETDSRGEMIGGPMEYMEKGMKSRASAVIFAILAIGAAIGTGNLVQVNAMAEAIGMVVPANPWVIGTVLSGITAVVVMGGVKSIGRVAGVLVPLMSLFYIGGGLLIIGMHIDQVPSAFALIFKSAFSGQAAFGGFAGAGIMMAIQMGAARSVFSNEAGMGISSVAAAAAQTDRPARQALITMSGTVLSTLVVCTITGLVIAVTGVFGTIGPDGTQLNGVALAVAAFDGSILGGSYIVTIGLILFAFSTVLAWAYYGEKAIEYLLGERAITPFRILFSLIVIPAAAIEMRLAWAFADIANGLMMIPNLFALIYLSKIIRSETELFIKEIEGVVEHESA